MLGIQVFNKLHLHIRLLLLTFVTCLIPFLLNLFGVDFSSTIKTLPEQNILAEDIFKAVAGSLHHALLEWFAVAIAGVVTFVSFLHYKIKRDVTVPIVGLALLSAGVIDAFHTLAATRIITTSAPDADFIPFTWALSRVFNGFLMLVVACFSYWLSKKYLTTKQENYHYNFLAISVVFFSVLSSSVLILAASSESLPQTMFNHALISRPYDVLPLALFLCAGAFFWLWYKDKNTTLRFALVVSIIPEVATQMHMAFGSTALFDNHFNIAHFLKNIAYGSILLGLLLDLIEHDNGVENANTYAESSEQEKHALRVGNSLVKDKYVLGHIKWPLAFKIPLIGFLFSLVISLLIGITFYLESKQLVVEQELTKLEIEASMITPLVEQFFHQGASDVKFLTGTPPIKGIIDSKNNQQEQLITIWQERLTSIFVELLKTKPHYLKISYITIGDNTQQVVSSERREENVIGIKRKDLVQNIKLDVLKPILSFKENKTFYSNIEYQKITDKKQATFIVAIPVFQNNSGLFGFVAIEVNLTSYLQSLKNSALSKLDFYFVDNNGEYIFPIPVNTNNKQAQTILNDFPVMEGLLTNAVISKRIIGSLGSENESFAFYSQISFDQIDPLLLILKAQNETFLLAVNNMRYRAFILGISLAFICLMLSILAARRVVKPLAQISQSVSKYEETKVLDRLPVNADDEIGVLAKSFHNLFVSLEHQSKQQQKTAIIAQNASLKLQAILNSIVDAVITIDEKGDILAFNKAARQIFGYQESEVLNQNITMLMPEDIAKHHDGFLQKYLSGGEKGLIGKGRELPAIRKDGETFPMHLSVSEVITEEGTIFTGLIRDITENKLIEAEKKRILTEAKSAAWRLNFALSAPKIGVWDLDLISGRILWDNRMYQLYESTEQTHLSPKEIWKAAIHPDDVNSVERQLARAINSGKELHYMHRIILANGMVKHIEAHAQVMFDEKGNKVRIVGTNRDNTDQFNLQEIKQQALDMAEESLKLKSEFLASMSHEIRTPMNGVLGMLGLLEQSALNKQQNHHVQLASSSAQSLLSLINDILDFSKIEAGKLDLEILDFDLRSQFGEFAESMAVKAQEKDLELILDLTEVNITAVKGDPSRIRQIMSNLVGNAIKFTQNGEIVIKAILIEKANSLELTCDIRDTGIGIPQEKLSTLFDSFTQVDATTTRKYGGTGLGLAIVKQLCEIMGGSIGVSSQLEQGSCFSFTIQLDKSEQAQLVMPNVNIDKANILIVDDNATNREVLTGQLEIWGANVTQAKDASVALDLIEQHPEGRFSVAILDMQMPDMNGADLGKKILERTKSKNTKLIMMTSMSERGDAAYFSGLGFSAYFPKPATTSDLFDALAIVLDKTNSEGKPFVTHQTLQTMHSNELINIKPKQARLLVVEDNRINQVVLQGVLANIDMHSDVAGNGLEALDLLNNCPVNARYELIIMDCQMPELDGYETTKAIRTGKAGDHYLNIPIIAMTANAMKGDEEKCLSVGMSDYATKPINADILQEKLCHWLGTRNDIAEQNSTENKNSLIDNSNTEISLETDIEMSAELETEVSPIWNVKALMLRIRNNHALANKLIDLYLTESPPLIEDVVVAIDGEDATTVASIAHKLKGSSHNIAGEKFALLMDKIEMHAKSQEIEVLRLLVTQIKEEFNQLFDTLNLYKSQ